MQWNGLGVESCLLYAYLDFLHFRLHHYLHYFDCRVDHVHGPLEHTKNFLNLFINQ